MSTEPDGGFEADVRTMFHRRAVDVVDRPVTTMPTGAAANGRGSGHGRVLLAIAAAVVLLLGIGAVAVGSGGDDRGERVVATAPDEPTSTTDPSPSTTEEQGVDGSPTTTDPDATTTSTGRVPPSSTVPDTSGTDPTGPGTGGGPGPTDPPASEAEGEPTITLHSIGVHRSAYGRCDGEIDVTGTTTQIWIERSGSRLAPAVTVPLRVSGTLASPAPASITIPEGSWDGFADVEVPAAGAVDLEVELVSGPGYALGTPSRQATSDPEPEMVLDCLRPVAADPARGALAQTVEVGQRPEDISFLVEHMGLSWPRVVSGAVPGLTLEHDGDSRDAVAVWSGAATTPGTYTLVVRFCHAHPDQICDGTARVTITVLPG